MTKIQPFYIGTYTNSKALEAERSQGIYRAELDMESGQIVNLQPAAWGISANFLALSADKRFLYAVGDTFQQDVKPNGVVAVFAIDPTSGALSLLNQQPTPNGVSCHLTVDATNRLLVSVSYGKGSFATYPLAPDGTIGAASACIQHNGKGADPVRQDAAHAHQAVFSPDNRFLLVNDLGIDRIMRYQVELGGETPSVRYVGERIIRAGAGPRHLEFHPNGHFLYLINELNATVCAFAYEQADGTLRELQMTPTLPESYSGEKWCADIHVHPNGETLYGSNRGHDSIAIFRIESPTGRLMASGHQPSLGKTPRAFAIEPSGRFLLVANQNSNTIVPFHVEDHWGGLKPVGVSSEVPSPCCLVFVNR